MLAKILDLQDASQYDHLTNEKMFQFKQNPEVIDFTKKDLKFHTRAANFDPSTQVQVRFLHDATSPVNFQTGEIKKFKPKYAK